jgi:hypothetical protein
MRVPSAAAACTRSIAQTAARRSTPSPQLAATLGVSLGPEPSDDVVIVGSQPGLEALSAGGDSADGARAGSRAAAPWQRRGVGGDTTESGDAAPGGSAAAPDAPPLDAAKLQRQLERYKKRLERTKAAAEMERQASEAEHAWLAAEADSARRDAEARAAAAAQAAAAGPGQPGGRVRAPQPDHWDAMSPAEADGFKVVALPLPGSLHTEWPDAHAASLRACRHGACLPPLTHCAPARPAPDDLSASSTEDDWEAEIAQAEAQLPHHKLEELMVGAWGAHGGAWGLHGGAGACMRHAWGPACGRPPPDCARLRPGPTHAGERVDTR